MKMLTGFLEPDAGSARIAGIDVLESPKLAKAKLGYLPRGALLRRHDRARFLPSSRDPRLRLGRSQARVDAAVDKTELAAVLSRGSRRCPRASSGASPSPRRSCTDPQVLIMDEPTDGLDPNQKHQVRKLIAQMAENKAIVVSTHILERGGGGVLARHHHQPRPHRRGRHGRGADAPVCPTTMPSR
jgi:ABC-2 type transport system ATP-binding protein